MKDDLIERLEADDLLPADMEFLVEEAAQALRELQPNSENIQFMEEQNLKLQARIAELEAENAKLREEQDRTQEDIDAMYPPELMR